MEATKEEQAYEYWADRAEEYSQLHMDSYLSNERMAYAPQVALSMPTGDDINALDLGCGSGFMSLLLLDAGCRVTGIDLTTEMLEHARDNVRRKGHHACFLQMRAQELAFPDNTFDYIVSRNVTWMCEDVETVYAEVMRVLKDDGIFLNLDANYGRIFREAETRGEKPTHPTQTTEQLRRRNDIVRDLPISLVDRPQWDIDQLWRLGASEIRCRRTDIHKSYTGYQSSLFALEVHGQHTPSSKDDFDIATLKIPSQRLLDGAAWKVTRSVRGSSEQRAIFADYVRVGTFEFDPRKFVVMKGDVPIALTPKEFNILFTLARKAPHTVSREELLESSWGSEFVEKTTDLAVYVRRIREKIEDNPSDPKYLLTKWGAGYVFVPEGTPTRN